MYRDVWEVMSSLGHGIKGKYRLTASHRKVVEVRKLNLEVEGHEQKHYTNSVTCRNMTRDRKSTELDLEQSLKSPEGRENIELLFTSLSYLDGNPFRNIKCIRNH